MIDTHCHLTFPEFSGDPASVGEKHGRKPFQTVEQCLADARAVGVSGVITISTTIPDARRCLAVAETHDRVWSSAGVHPLYADQGPHHWTDLDAVIRHPKCVAWGELGLDNHYAEPAAPQQRDVLQQQLTYILSQRSDARVMDKPIILHCREAFGDLIPFLRTTGIPGDRFVFHCFTGTPADMRLLLDFGAMVSFTGVVTYKNAPEVREAMLLAPLNRIMVETDAPFLPPEPRRTERPCRPAFARLTADFLAAARGISFDELHRAINANTRRFFGIENP